MDDWVLLSKENSSDEEIVVSSPPMASEKENSSDENEYSSDEINYSSDDQEYLPYNQFFFADDTESDRAALINKTLPHLLPRLPAKTLLRFKSVSPKFKNFITSPFIVLSHSIFPRRMSGLFYHLYGIPCYVSFDQSPNASDLPDPSLSFMPEIVTIKASTRGILCVRGRENYYVVNPVTKEWVELPKHSGDHGDDVAVVILFDEPDVYNFGGDYKVVCAYQVIEGVYGFETFSSKSWKWDQSSEICAVERIIPSSGVAVGAAAYWRTTMHTIVVYKPASLKVNSKVTQNGETNGNIMKGGDSLRMLSHEIEPHFQYELGEMEGNLAITSKSSGDIQVHVMEETNGEFVRWRKKGSFWNATLIDDERSAILRSHGKAELLLWEFAWERIDQFSIDNRGKKELVLRNLNGTVLSKIEGLEYCADFLPFIGTLVPVKRSTVAPTEEASSSGNAGLDISGCKSKPIEPRD
ncbi:hypothetical protein LUZ60_005075 [Juncus effusus]|nr:hypothetical protein LUZ60_005075 [Juncus effusus]